MPTEFKEFVDAQYENRHKKYFDKPQDQIAMLPTFLSKLQTTKLKSGNSFIIR